jgi:signal transduction histidine kinase
LIAVQAGAADALVEDQPAQARQALAHVRQASRTALGQLRDTVGLLRDAGQPAAPVEPVLGLSGLADLLADFRRSGLTVDERVSGPVRPAPTAVDLTAYRVIQEALTNVSRHAGTPARLALTYQPDALVVQVENPLPAAGSEPPEQTEPPEQAAPTGPPDPHGPPEPAAAGHGIAGMRERVTAVGGSLLAGPVPAGPDRAAVFRVLARLPLAAGGPR